MRSSKAHDLKDQMQMVRIGTDGQKILVSGSMTIKISSENLDKPTDPPQTAPDKAAPLNVPTVLNNSDYISENSGGVKIYPNSKLGAAPQTVGLSTDQEEVSMKNLNHIKSSTGSDKSLPHENNQEETNNADLAVIEQPKAHVRTSQEYVLARDSQADYEEFRQAGIISTKFSSVKDQSARDSASVGQPLEARGVGTATNNTDLAATMTGAGSSSQDQGTQIVSDTQKTAEF